MRNLLLILLTGILLMTTQTSSAEDVYTLPISPSTAAGSTTHTTLGPYKGKVMLIVNVASKCGYTKQYEGLEALHKKYSDQGLVVVGFPSNDFKGQEPGTDAEIAEFCTATYGVTFPIFGKIVVKGEGQAPLYKYLTEGDHPGKSEVGWNFNKYLVGRDGKVIAHYESKVAPESPELDEAIQAELGKK